MDILQLASLQAFISSYVEEGIPANTGPSWSRSALDEAIKNRPHTSECALDMASFIWGELQRLVQDEFSILLSAEDTVLFLERISSSIALQRSLRISAVLN